MPSFSKLFLLIVFVSLSFLGKYMPVVASNSHSVTFFDVGQGSSFLIQTPLNCRIMIDLGPPRKFAKAYAESFGFLKPKIHFLILSHSDLDHIGDLEYVLRSFPIDRVLFNGTVGENPVSKHLQNWLLYNSKQHIRPWSGAQLNLCGIQVQFWHPSNQQEISALNSNDSSLGLHILLPKKQLQIVSAGDLGQEHLYSSGLVMHSGVPTLLVANHHGSRHSSTSEFLSQVKPDLVVIQAGVNNPYRHPHPKTLDRLCKWTDLIFETAKYGSFRLYLPYDLEQPDRLNLEIAKLHQRAPPQVCELE